MHQPIPESTEKAQAELDQLSAWLDQYEQMKANESTVEKRHAFLEGFLAKPVADPATNGEGKLEAVKEPEGATE